MLKVYAVHIIGVKILGAKLYLFGMKAHFTWCESVLDGNSLIFGVKSTLILVSFS